MRGGQREEWRNPRRRNGFVLSEERDGFVLSEEKCNMYINGDCDTNRWIMMRKVIIDVASC
jgi:hypothetical protein